uniref:p53 DNA-binding domain-containing protein n=1 Tax=Dendroctonus ponderosae TaxID=77166 RepID=J3JTU1_DENPD|nr:unknown [Dendroctonus ponderosae]
MSLSQISGLSDIIPDVEKFIAENGMIDDVSHLMEDESQETDHDQEEYCKPLLVELYPPEQPLHLTNEEYEGPFNFEVLVLHEEKTPWEYSTKLNKIYITQNLKFPMAFSVEPRPKNKKLFVRLTPVFSQSQYFHEIVHRCVMHQRPQDGSNKDLPAHVHQHVVRCTNEQTAYFGDYTEGTRLSVVVPLQEPQHGTDLIKEFYYFVCVNSCALGMNRRPIELVFTLEDQEGEVFGRRVIAAKICSCPKRDRAKDEKEFKRSQVPSGKRIKLDSDKRVFKLSGTIIGKENYLHVLKVAKDRMAA